MGVNARIVSIGGIAASLVVGALIAMAGSSGGAELASFPTFAWCAIVAFAINWVVFVPSFISQTEHYYDLTGSLTYLSLLAFALAFGAGTNARSWLLGALIATWAVRLGSFLFRRVKQDGRDGRFDDLKPDFLRFLMTWTIQGLWVFLTLACALAALTVDDESDLGPLAIIGALIWFAGFAVEVVADQQKRLFRADPANAGAFITKGLWAWSRHPNYFGEIVLWCGIALIALPTLSGWRYVTLISPVFVYVLITRISGVPLLESRASKKWGDDPAYRAYKSATPSLILRPPRR